MSHQEKRSIANLLNTLLVYTFFYFVIIQAEEPWSFLDTPNLHEYWGTVFIVLIPVYIVMAILIQILITIVHKIQTGEDMPDFVDELDKLIQLKTSRNGIFVFFLGFMIAMGSQAFGSEPIVMFKLLYLTMFLTGIMSEVTQLYFYRLGVSHE